MIYTIYCITNIKTNKKYIGYTKKKPETRFREHFNHAKSGSNYKIHQAIRKYNREDFLMEELETCDETIAKEREKFWISSLDTYKSGYNMTIGGDGIIGTKVKYRRGKDHHLFGISISDEQNKKLQDGARQYYETHDRYRWSESERKEISERRSKTYVLIFPDGRKETVTNLWQYCKGTHLDACQLYKVVSGKIKTHKGHKCYEITD